MGPKMLWNKVYRAARCVSRKPGQTLTLSCLLHTLILKNTVKACPGKLVNFVNTELGDPGGLAI